MSDVGARTPPRLECRELPGFDAGDLHAVLSAFASAQSCTLGQCWHAQTEADFRAAIVRAGWRENSLLILAELEDADIFTRATAHNQRMWELGDTLEIFLQLVDSPAYVEFHVTPNNLRLQLRFPDPAAQRRAQAANSLDELILPDGTFRSHTWTQPENSRWFVFAEIPARSVCGAPTPLPGCSWRFSFSRYDYRRDRPEPVISSSSPHAQPNFHRREEWGVLIFV